MEEFCECNFLSISVHCCPSQALKLSFRLDGIDVSTIGLYDLRSKLTFITQDAILFSGTMRSNIDPLQEYTDAELILVLGRVGLLDGHQKITLESAVEVEGKNFSDGQQQLISLARALLRNSKVVVMDEVGPHHLFQVLQGSLLRLIHA